MEAQRGGGHAARVAELVEYPPLHACYRADLTTALRSAHHETFRDTDAPERPEAHRRQLTSQLAAHGYTPYFSSLHAFRNGAEVVSVLVPGLERFVLITDGQFVVPEPRALAARHTPREPGVPISAC